MAKLVAVVVVAGGCNIVFGFDDIHPGAGPDGGSIAAGDASGQVPVAFASPGPLRIANGYSYVGPVSVTVAADDPTAMIYYTTDGSTPTVASKHAMTPVAGIVIGSQLTLSYFGKNVAGAGSPTLEAYYIDPSKTSSAGYVVTNTKLDGTSPVVVASPGQKFTVATATVQMWVQSNCAGCQTQLVYGVDLDDQGCLFDSGPGLFAGVTTSTTFTVTAPSTPGIHEVRVADSEQFTCADAIAMHTLQTRPNLARIGVIVVR